MQPASERIVKYIGKPYEGYNCFQLTRDFYTEFFQLSLREYYDSDKVPPRAEIQSLIFSNTGDFTRVESPMFGDIVVINLYGYSCHIAVYLGEGKILHTIRNIGSCIEPLRKYLRNIEGFYRHNPLKGCQA